MKRTIAILLIVLLAFSLPVVCSAATVNKENGSARVNILAEYVPNGSTSSSIYSVEIVWGDVNFKYTPDPKVWDPESGTYIDSGSGTWTTNSNGEFSLITVINRSNVPITAVCSYEANSQYADVGMSFEPASLSLGSAANTDAITRGTIKMIPTGTLPKVEAGTEIGAVIITIQ